MIRLIEKTHKINALNPFAIRIKALYNAYAETNLCDFYIDTKTNCVMAKCGNVLIVDGESLTDENELKSFCSVAGVNTILCSGDFKLNSIPEKEGYILKYAGSMVDFPEKDAVINDNLRDIYSLLSANMKNTFTGIKFEDYYVDLSHKLRHGCAASLIIYENNVPCSCAVAPFICDEGAVISAVCTDMNLRERGYGTAAICSLINHLNANGITDIYLQIEDKSLLDFYYPLGFSAVGTWQEVKI